MATPQELREAFAAGKGAVRDEYRALKRHGYLPAEIRGDLAGDLAGYRPDLERAESNGDAFHASFIRGCIEAAREASERN